MMAFRWAYLSLFAYIGCFGPFMTSWLTEGLGLSDGSAGAVMAAALTTGILSSFLISRRADARRTRCALQRRLAWLAALLLPLWLVVPSDWAIPLAILQGLLIPVQVPFLDAAVLDALGSERHRYGRLRLFGTVGFGVGMLCLSALRDSFPPLLIPAGQALTIAVFAMVVRRLPDTQSPLTDPVARKSVDLEAGLGFWLLLGIAFLHGLATSHFEFFSARHLKLYGLSAPSVGVVLACGIAAETLLFYFAPRFIARVPGQRLLALALATSALRWAILPSVSTFLGFALLQSSHALTFGLWYAATLQLAARLSNPAARTTAQAMVSGIFGAGAALGGLLAGFGRDAFGVATTFRANAVVALLALLLLLIASRRFEPKIGAALPEAK